MNYTKEIKRGFPITNDPEVLVFHMEDDVPLDVNAGKWLERKSEDRQPKTGPTGRTVGEILTQVAAEREKLQEQGGSNAK